MEIISVEDFLMVVLVSSIVGAVASVIVAMINNFRVHKKVDKDMETKLELHINDTAHWQTALSKEHDGLSKEHDRLREQLGAINNTTSFLKDEQIKESIKIDGLKEQHQDLFKSAENIGQFAKEFAAISAENAQLQNEISQLKAEIAKFRQPAQNRNMYKTDPER